MSDFQLLIGSLCFIWVFGLFVIAAMGPKRKDDAE